MKEKLESKLLDVFYKSLYNTDNKFGSRFKLFRRMFELPDELISEFFTTEEYSAIIDSNRAKDLNKELLMQINTFLINYNSILENYPNSIEAGLIAGLVNEIHDVLNMEPIILRDIEEKEKVYNPKDDKYVLYYGPLFPDDVECDCIGNYIIDQMVVNKQIEGSYIAEVMATEYGIETIKFDHDIDNIEFDILPVNTKKLEKLKEQYLHLMLHKKEMENYDNSIVIVVDFPENSGLNNTYVTETILVSSKEKAYFINLGCSKEYYYREYVKLMDESKKILIKKLTN